LTPGKYDLRIAVMDDGNSRIGSLEIPIEIAAEGRIAKK
jgi:hypothetical protein